jgi:competence protein ComEC
MVAIPWFSAVLLTAVLWWPGGWPAEVPPELAAIAVVLASLPGGRCTLWLLLPVLLGVLQADRHLERRLPADMPARDYLLRGQICSFPVPGERAVRFQFQVDTTDLPPGFPKRLRLAWYETKSSLRAGEQWQLVVRLRAPRGLASPGAFDAERAALVADTGGRGYVRDSALNRKQAAGQLQCPTLMLRRWVAERVLRSLGDHEAAGHVLAITVGARQRLERDDWALLRRTGTVHLMAISGLHIGLVAGTAFLMGRVLGGLLVYAGWWSRPRSVAVALSLTAATAYAALAGFALPTQRALLMLGVWSACRAAGAGATPWTIVAVALWAILLVDGLAVLSAGFWLSFVAVVALLMAGLSAGNAASSAGRIRKLFAAQWRVFVGLAPIGAMAFGQVALVAPLANLVAVPLFGIVVMPLALIGTLLAAAGGTGLPLLWAADVTAQLLHALSRLPAGLLAVPPIPRCLLPAVVLGCLALLWPPPSRWRWVALPLLLLPAVLAPSPPPAGSVRVQVLDVGQGLAVIVQTHSHALLYDTGPDYGSGDAGSSVVLPALRHGGIGQVDLVVLSHGDLDHAGGAGSIHTAHPRSRFLAPLPDRVSVPAEPCRYGQAWRWDSVTFRVLHPGVVRERGSANDRSCVLLVEAANARVLLPGDITGRVETALLGQLPGTGVDLVVAAHHGSATSSAAAFVDRTQPRYVVFAAGFGNRWGFPRPEVVSRWARAGSCLLTTGLEGSVLFDSASGELTLGETYRRTHARGWTARPPDQPCQTGRATL